MPVVRFTDVASRMFGILTACLALAIMYTSNDLIRDNKPSPASRGVPEPEGAWFHTNEIWDGEWLSVQILIFLACMITLVAGIWEATVAPPTVDNHPCRCCCGTEHRSCILSLRLIVVVASSIIVYTITTYRCTHLCGVLSHNEHQAKQQQAKTMLIALTSLMLGLSLLAAALTRILIRAQSLLLRASAPVGALPRRRLVIRCPLGAGPGTRLTVATPEDAQLQVIVPRGACPGRDFVWYIPSALPSEVIPVVMVDDLQIPREPDVVVEGIPVPR